MKEDELPAGYYDQIVHKNSIRKYWHYFKFKEIVKEIGTNPNRILDIGCASGTFLGRFLSNFNDLEKTGLDISLNQITYADKHYRNTQTKFFCGKLWDLKFKDNYFDVITCSEVIEHLPKEEIIKYLKIILKILKPGGKLIITTPDYKSYWPYLEIIVDLAFKQQYSKQHLTKFNKATLTELLNKTGLKVDKCRNILGLSPFIAPFFFNLSEKVSQLENYGALILCSAIKN